MHLTYSSTRVVLLVDDINIERNRNEIQGNFIFIDQNSFHMCKKNFDCISIFKKKKSLNRVRISRFSILLSENMRIN